MTHHALQDLSLGKTLEMSNMVALDILELRFVVIELLRALGPLAKSHYCNKVMLVVTGSGIVPEDLLITSREAEPTHTSEQVLKCKFPDICLRSLIWINAAIVSLSLYGGYVARSHRKGSFAAHTGEGYRDRVDLSFLLCGL
jgi:hypothetical protein